jgi:hypothetical protein
MGDHRGRGRPPDATHCDVESSVDGPGRAVRLGAAGVTRDATVSPRRYRGGHGRHAVDYLKPTAPERAVGVGAEPSARDDAVEAGEMPQHGAQHAGDLALAEDRDRPLGGGRG